MRISKRFFSILTFAIIGCSSIAAIPAQESGGLFSTESTVTITLEENTSAPTSFASSSSTLLNEEEEAAIVSSVVYAPVPARFAMAPPIPAAAPGGKPICYNINAALNMDLRGWAVENSRQDTYDIVDNGLAFNLLPPKQYVRLVDANTNLTFNQIGGRGPTLNASSYMRYGRVSATLRSSRQGGSVTAFILIADGGDEIDFEWLGEEINEAQTNYFYGKHVEYNVNGGRHKVLGGPVDTVFHTYTIDWSPERIEWLVDNKVVRTKKKSDTCGKDGICKYPTEPARVQFGLWDGSIEFGTAEWSHGPINWDQQPTVHAIVKDVKIECDPQYNEIAKF